MSRPSAARVAVEVVALRASAGRANNQVVHRPEARRRPSAEAPRAPPAAASGASGCIGSGRSCHTSWIRVAVRPSSAAATVGSTRAQNGHWKSAHSWTVTFAARVAARRVARRAATGSVFVSGSGGPCPSRVERLVERPPAACPARRSACAFAISSSMIGVELLLRLRADEAPAVDEEVRRPVGLEVVGQRPGRRRSPSRACASHRRAHPRRRSRPSSRGEPREHRRRDRSFCAAKSASCIVQNAASPFSARTSSAASAAGSACGWKGRGSFFQTMRTLSPYFVAERRRASPRRARRTGTGSRRTRRSSRAPSRRRAPGSCRRGTLKTVVVSSSARRPARRPCFGRARPVLARQLGVDALARRPRGDLRLRLRQLRVDDALERLERLRARRRSTPLTKNDGVPSHADALRRRAGRRRPASAQRCDARPARSAAASVTPAVAAPTRT